MGPVSLVWVRLDGGKDGSGSNVMVGGGYKVSMVCLGCGGLFHLAVRGGECVDSVGSGEFCGVG